MRAVREDCKRRAAAPQLRDRLDRARQRSIALALRVAERERAVEIEHDAGHARRASSSVKSGFSTRTNPTPGRRPSSRNNVMTARVLGS